MKRFLLTLAAIISALGIYAIEGESYGFRFDFSASGAKLLGPVKYGAHYNSSYSIPNTAVLFYDDGSYKEFPVTSIAAEAFAGATEITHISLPSTLQSIGDKAFKGTRISSITIPAKVKWLGSSYYSNAFYNCQMLSSIIYLPLTPPTYWVACGKTYVPDLLTYTSYFYHPNFRMNNAEIIEMVTFETDSFEYTGHAPKPNWVCNMPHDDFSVDLDLSGLSSDIGPHVDTIPMKFTHSYENNRYPDIIITYDVIYRYTIVPKQIKAQIVDTTRVYGDENPHFRIKFSGFAEGEDEKVFSSDPIVSTDATPKSPVGNYSVTLAGGAAKNYTFKYVPGVLTITKAPLTATINDTTKSYGQNNPKFAVTYNGLKNSEVEPIWSSAIEFCTSATKLSPVGEYSVTATGVPVNYELDSIQSGTLTVLPAPLMIKAEHQSRLYYETNPNFTYVCTGLLNGDNLTKEPVMKCTAVQSSDAGEYVISPENAECPNYAITYEPGKLTISKRTLQVKPNDVSRSYAEDNPELGYNIFGFVNNEDISVLSRLPNIYTNATSKSDVGTYPIYAKDAEATNYNFTYHEGSLTINKANQEIIWEQELFGAKVGDQILLNAFATSDLDIEYALSSNIASLYGTAGNRYLDCLKEGTITIKATQDGNKNYNPAVRIAKTLSIESATGIATIISESYKKPVFIDLQGRRVILPIKGSVIIKIDKGKASKIFVK